MLTKKTCYWRRSGVFIIYSEEANAGWGIISAAMHYLEKKFWLLSAVRLDFPRQQYLKIHYKAFTWKKRPRKMTSVV